jgi:hypothetical protein
MREGVKECFEVNACARVCVRIHKQTCLHGFTMGAVASNCNKFRVTRIQLSLAR